MARKQGKIAVEIDKEIEEAADSKTVDDIGDNTEQISSDEDPVLFLEAKLKAAENEARESHDKMLRAAAEHDNHKKRMQREAEEFRKFANESLIKALLPVVDNLERAVESAGADHVKEKAIVEGVKMTLKEIYKVFEQFHLKPLESEGKPFDPNFHQAVMQEETSEYPENTVIKEMQRGYILHDRLIRPAMVIVSKAASKNDCAAAAGPS